MLKNYFITFLSKSGKRVGMTISAQSSYDAILYAESLPDFDTMIQYPQEV